MRLPQNETIQLWKKAFQSPENGEVLCDTLNGHKATHKDDPFQSPENGEVLCDIVTDPRFEGTLKYLFQSPENGEVLCDKDGKNF